MDEQCLVHPDMMPDAGLASARKAQRFDPGRADMAGFERRGQARWEAGHRARSRYTSTIILPPKQQAPVAQGLASGLFFGRAAGTAVRFAAGKDRCGGSILEFPQEVVGDDLEELAFDGAIAPASSSQSLENPHRVLR
jgi:hypothetical protein